MSEKKPQGLDTQPKCSRRSWSADSYVWRGKKPSQSSCYGLSPRGLEIKGSEELGVRSKSCTRWHRERKCSCSTLGDALASADIDVVCQKALSRRFLRQKFQDAVDQCFPLRSHHHLHHHHHHPSGFSRPFSVLFWSKRKIHISELMQDKCPFSPKSELARCWHLIKKQTNSPSAVKDMEAPLKPHVSSSSTSPPQTPLS